MLYPVMPIYLKSIGFSVVLIGLLEGFAEATAGLSKGYFGKLSDVSGRRVPFVQIGYALSALSKPLMAAFAFPMWIFFVRTIDRFGKGIRTGARDAILSDEATPQTKGKIFGFHRSMDTLGAAIGPLLALIYLYHYPKDYKSLFIIALIPGLLSIITSLYLKEKKEILRKEIPRVPLFSFLKYWKASPAAYRKLVSGLLLFALFNSSDVFLLLQLKQNGMEDTVVIGVYIFYNLIYALAAFPLGILADKIGLKTIFIFGLVLFSIVYFGITMTTNLYCILGLFFIYGIYAAATEGISKAWISNITDKKDTATAIGTYSGLQSISALLASSLTGWIWYQFNAATAFLSTAITTLFLVFYFVAIPSSKSKTNK
jgi:MFS family permease